MAHAGGVVCLLCGSAGAGKTAVAQAIAYELGQPIKVRALSSFFALLFVLLHP